MSGTRIRYALLGVLATCFALTVTTTEHAVAAGALGVALGYCLGIQQRKDES